MSEITASETGSKGRYALRIDGHAAELTYSRAGPALIILDHTDVPPALRGRGLGELLVAHAVEQARAAGTKIAPLCPFAAAQFRKRPDFQDVLSR